MTAAIFRNKEKDFNLLIDIIIGLAVGVIIALIIVLVQKSGLKTVRRQAVAKNYIRQGSFNLTVQNEQFLYSNVERIKKEDETPSNGKQYSYRFIGNVLTAARQGSFRQKQ